jgi:hypothetical protein
MSDRGWMIVGLVLLLPPSCIEGCAIHDRLLAANFERVAVGMPRDEVISVLGPPRDTVDCTAPGPFKPWQRPDCAETYLYPSWGAPIIPEMWAVWFNASGSVIDKDRFVSR